MVAGPVRSIGHSRGAHPPDRSVRGLCGPDAARFFYDEDHVQRRSAIPMPVRKTLSGQGSVHTHDGREHRNRKAFFLSLLTPVAAEGIADAVGVAWDDTVAG